MNQKDQKLRLKRSFSTSVAGRYGTNSSVKHERDEEMDTGDSGREFEPAELPSKPGSAGAGAFVYKVYK